MFSTIVGFIAGSVPAVALGAGVGLVLTGPEAAERASPRKMSLDDALRTDPCPPPFMSTEPMRRHRGGGLPPDFTSVRSDQRSREQIVGAFRGGGAAQPDPELIEICAGGGAVADVVGHGDAAGVEHQEHVGRLAPCFASRFAGRFAAGEEFLLRGGAPVRALDCVVRAAGGPHNAFGRAKPSPARERRVRSSTPRPRCEP